MGIEISIVIPIYNEETNIHELYSRLTKVVGDLSVPYEILFTDDGSSDMSLEKLKAISVQDRNVRILRLSRNFGHHIAITAGLRHARGRYVLLMDGDLQDRPEDIPTLYHKILEGYDCVYGIRKSRSDSTFKQLTSKLFNYFLNRSVALQVPISSAIFRILSRRFVDNFNKLNEKHRFICGLMSWLGFKQTGVEVVHASRHSGKTKYPVSKMLTLATNSFISFSFVPIKIISVIGIWTSLMSLVGIAVLFYRKIVLDLGVTGWTSVMVTVLFLGGIQLLALGMIGEYIARGCDEQKQRPLFLIEEKINFEAPVSTDKEAA